MNNKKLRYINRKELKPYADSEKLGYIFITGTIDTSQKHIFKDKVLAKCIKVSVKKLIWEDRNRFPIVIEKELGFLDHAFLPKEIAKYTTNNVFNNAVQVVSYQRYDDSTSVGFDILPPQKYLCANLIDLIDSLKKVKINKALKVKVADSMIDSLELLRHSYMQRGGKGFGTLTMVDLDLNLIEASVFVVEKLLDKNRYKLPKKSKGFGTV